MEDKKTGKTKYDRQENTLGMYVKLHERSLVFYKRSAIHAIYYTCYCELIVLVLELARKAWKFLA